MFLKTLNVALNPICNLLAFFGTHPILHVSRIRVNCSTRFGRHTAHQQELKNRNCSIWFYICVWLPVAAAMVEPSQRHHDVESCWIYEYIGILLGARPILHISRIKVKQKTGKMLVYCIAEHKEYRCDRRMQLIFLLIKRNIQTILINRNQISIKRVK
jgi:hypothetical protein